MRGQGTGRTGRAQTAAAFPPRQCVPIPEVPEQDGGTAAVPVEGVPAPRSLRPVQLMGNSVTQHGVDGGGTLTRLPRNEGTPG